MSLPTARRSQHPEQANADAVPALPDDLKIPAARLTSEAAAISLAWQLAAEFAETGAARERETLPPFDELRRASATGLTAALVPRHYGGIGASIVTLAEIIKAISTTNPSVGQILIAQYTLGDVVTWHGSVAQQDFFLPRILGGLRIGNAMTEAGTRSAADIQTRLLPAPEGGYLLNGQKFYTTGSYTSHWFPVLALNHDEDAVFAFINRDDPALTLLDDWRGVGQRATVSGTAIFKDLKVEERFVIKPKSHGKPHTGNTFAQLLHAAVDTGIALGALEEAIRFLNDHSRAWPEGGVERTAQEPHVIKTFGELKVQQLAAEALVRRGAEALDAVRAAPDDSDLQSAAILAVHAARAQADQAALAAASEIFALGGARAGQEKWNLDRFWRNARTHTVHDPVRWQYHHIGDYFLNGVELVDNARAKRR